jgi:hypothetical protein
MSTRSCRRWCGIDAAGGGAGNTVAAVRSTGRRCSGPTRQLLACCQIRSQRDIVAAVTVAALVLGVIGTVLSASSLSWNMAQFQLQGARPKLTAVAGVITADAGHLLCAATTEMTDTLRQTIEQFDGPIVVGVQVANKGRAPFHVAGWGIRRESSTDTFVPERNPLGHPTVVSCDIAPGAHALFLTELANAFIVTAGAERSSLRVQMVIYSGGRNRLSDAVPLALLKAMENARTKTIIESAEATAIPATNPSAAENNTD